MAHTNHMRYSNNAIGKDDPQPSHLQKSGYIL